MSQQLVLVAETGRAVGTRESRRLRREGKVPATVYGLGRDPQTVAVDWRELRRVLTTDMGVNAFIDLQIGGKQQPSLVKEIQRHPTRREVIHIDFLRVDPNVVVEVEVSIELVGDADQVTMRGGIVEQLLHSIVISAKPGDIPASIELDVSGLTFERSLKVSDLQLPAGLTTNVEADDVVVQGALTAAGEAAAAAPAAD